MSGMWREFHKINQFKQHYLFKSEQGCRGLLQRPVKSHLYLYG